MVLSTFDGINTRSFFLFSYNFSYLEHSVYSFYSATVSVFHFLLISKAVPFFFEKNLFLRFKLEITSFYLWAHAGCTISIIKRCQTQVNNCSSLCNTQCNKPCICYKERGRGCRVGGGGGLFHQAQGESWARPLKGTLSKGDSSPPPSPTPPPPKQCKKYVDKFGNIVKFCILLIPHCEFLGRFFWCNIIIFCVFCKYLHINLSLRVRSSLVVRASDCQCTSCNGPGFDPSIRRHSGIWGTADEAVLNIVRHKNEKIPQKI